jgi:hypothetical protein
VKKWIRGLSLRGFIKPLRTAMAMVSFPISDDAAEKIRYVFFILSKQEN